MSRFARWSLVLAFGAVAVFAAPAMTSAFARGGGGGGSGGGGGPSTGGGGSGGAPKPPTGGGAGGKAPGGATGGNPGGTPGAGGAGSGKAKSNTGTTQGRGDFLELLQRGAADDGRGEFLDDATREPLRLLRATDLVD